MAETRRPTYRDNRVRGPRSPISRFRRYLTWVAWRSLSRHFVRPIRCVSSVGRGEVIRIVSEHLGDLGLHCRVEMLECDKADNLMALLAPGSRILRRQRPSSSAPGP